MRDRTWGFLAFALAWLGFASAAHAQLTEVIRGGSLTPGVGIQFSDVRPPSLDGRFLAFCGQSFQQFGKNGVYRVTLSTGAVTPVATDSTASPSGGGNFRAMCSTTSYLPSIDGGHVAFFGDGPAASGIYVWDGAAIATMVDDTTAFPGTAIAPLTWDTPSLSVRIAVGWSNAPQTPNFAGLYSFDDQDLLFAVIDTNETLESDFFNVSRGTVTATDAGVGGGSYVWRVNDSPTGAQHVYRRRFDPLGPIERIASTNDPLDAETFVLAPSNPQVDRSDPEQLCFMGGSPIGAVYRFDGTQVEIVADLATAIPHGTGSFTGFGLWCSIDAGDVVFSARGSGGQWGVYRGLASGGLERVVDTTTALGESFASQFEVSREAISNGRIAFRARIASNDSIWYAPEPGAIAAALVALAALAGVARRR